MRCMYALLFAVALAIPGQAQQPRQPTGYEIAGCADYYLDGARVRRICDRLDPRQNPRFWDQFAIIGGSDPQ